MAIIACFDYLLATLRSFGEFSQKLGSHCRCHELQNYNLLLNSYLIFNSWFLQLTLTVCLYTFILLSISSLVWKRNPMKMYYPDEKAELERVDHERPIKRSAQSATGKSVLIRKLLLIFFFCIWIAVSIVAMYYLYRWTRQKNYELVNTKSYVGNINTYCYETSILPKVC